MTALLDALARPATPRRGLVLAVVALAMTVVGGWGPSLLLAVGTVDPAEQAALVPLYLAGSALALLGLVPLLLAVLALVGRPATPAWLLGVALAVLLVRPLVLLLEAAASPLTVVPRELALPLFLTTAIAAGLAAIAVLPTTGPARRPERVAVVGVAVAALVGLALFAYTGTIVPVAAIGVVIALALRMKREREGAQLDDADADGDDDAAPGR